MRIRTCLTILFVAGLGLSAELPADLYFGRALEVPDARSVAMGGVTAVAGSPFGFMANPALGVLGFDRLAAPAVPGEKFAPAVGLAYRLGLNSEVRTRTVYDFYNNAVGELAIADNFAADALPGPLALSLPLSVLHLGVGLAPHYDYNYSFRQEFRDDFYQLLGRNDLQLSGQVMRADVSIAYDLLRAIGLGAGFAYDFGVRTLQRRDTATGDTWQTIESGKPAGIAWNAGLLVHPGRLFRFGLGFEPQTKYSGWSGALAVNDPMKVRLGVCYFAAGRIPAAVMGQVTYADWHGTDTTLSRVLEFRAGVEHRLLNSVSLRYGFGLLPSPKDQRVQTGLASVGLGFDTDLAHIDLGGSVTRRVFGSSFLSPALTVDTRIYQTGGELVLSITRAF